MLDPSQPANQQFYCRVDALNYQCFFFRLLYDIEMQLVLTDQLTEHTSALTYEQGFLDLADNATVALNDCVFSFFITSGTRALQPPPLVYELNYADNVQPSATYTTRVCSYFVGFYRSDGLWASPGCCDSCQCHAQATMRTKDVPSIPVYVPADPRVRLLDCAEVYPVRRRRSAPR